MTTYAEETGWKQYQRFFPPDFRCEGARLPDEEWLTWRGRNIHIDRHVTKNARGNRGS